LIERVIRSETQSPGQGFFGMITGFDQVAAGDATELSGIEAVASHTVEFTLSRSGRAIWWGLRRYLDRDAGFWFDPDRRLQEVIGLVFARFRERGSAHHVHLPMTAARIHFPRPSNEGRITHVEWLPHRYRNVIAILKNSFYAGVYVYSPVGM
jgi:hypothetical protein